ISAKVAYHDACHLAHAQGISIAPRKLLGEIPGLELCELPESDVCCGMAGAYYLQEADMADRLGSRKIENILGTGATIAAVADPGCLLQLQNQVRINNCPLKVVHTMELLDMSYR
ncbi:MAG: (Fe-S)-binding protein, partial [Thermoguttaceae bacterium]